MGTGEQHYHDLFSRMVEQYPRQAALFLTFNTPLARRIYAGSDMFLMPSRLEPCGTGQMIAMHYGSVPIVRATGGLADTVQDYDPRTGQGTGLRLCMPTTAGRCLPPWSAPWRPSNTAEVWRQIQLRGMSADFSWERSARRYVDLYRRAIGQPHTPARPGSISGATVMNPIDTRGWHWWSRLHGWPL